MVEQTFSKILLLAESTDEGMEAARSAIALAGDEEATLLILSVVDSHTLKQLLKNRIFVEDEMEQYEQDLEKSAQKQLNYVAQLASKAKVEHRTSLVRGACHTSVLNKQKETDADLLIMGTYRATTVKTELMGREKQLIIDEIPCPVLLVPK